VEVVTWSGTEQTTKRSTPPAFTPRRWTAHEIVNAPFVRLPEKYLRASLKVIAQVCTDQGFDLSAMLVDLEAVEVPDQRFNRPAEDSRTQAMLSAPYEKLSEQMLRYAFRRCAASCVARGINPETVLEI
jgi:hypothetical protein